MVIMYTFIVQGGTFPPQSHVAPLLKEIIVNGRFKFSITAVLLTKNKDPFNCIDHFFVFYSLFEIILPDFCFVSRFLYLM